MRTPHDDSLGSDNPEAPSLARAGAGAGAPAATPSLDAPTAHPSRQGKGSDGPERKCILSGEHDGRDDLVRLAISPEGEVLPDALARAPGRGAWLGVDRATLDAAVASGKLKAALARAFRGAALTVPADLGARIEAALSRALTERLGLELRAGNLLLGSDRIAERARAGQVAWLGHAVDAGEDGSRRLDQAWRVGREAEGTGLAGTTLPLDRATLSVALGRDNVVHLALTDSAAAQRVAAPLARLMRFLGRSGGGDSRPEPMMQTLRGASARRDDRCD